MKRYAALLLFSFIAIAAVAADELPPAEKQKIEALLKYVGGLTDAKFVRNDTEYEAETAVKFLRGKLSAEGDKIKTAKDFIEKCATASSTSGKPYVIRFKDGKESKCADLLLAELEKLK